ncbi:hypothetical protein J5N97_015123 [Dioscorea zingiberensis]|uniref:Uncharacterized protein n=1 Tax=Dioscorea zingiberensis TaxID=325984 RepID=A0A9D5CVH4_9LILI|nr:hypothetical protein J5N97_015123 [Dioscorea zingiberensis]
MHLWPSPRIREAFNHGYLIKLEWNLERMKRRPLSESEREEQGNDPLLPAYPQAKPMSILRDLSIIFCCAGCFDDEK